MFLLGRIREEFLAADGGQEAADHAARRPGQDRPGDHRRGTADEYRVRGDGGPGVSFMRMFGVGLTIAVLMDATLIRLLRCRRSCG